MIKNCRICGEKLGRRNHTARKNTTTNLCFSCIRQPPIEEQCIGITNKGVKCKIIKYRDSNYCKVHKHMERSE